MKRHICPGSGNTSHLQRPGHFSHAKPPVIPVISMGAFHVIGCCMDNDFSQWRSNGVEQASLYVLFIKICPVTYKVRYLAKASRGMKLENILKALYGEQALQ